MPRILKLTVILFFVSGLFFPAMAAGKRRHRGFFNQVGHFLGQTANFVITLPDKVTRPLGPVIGPIVSEVITGGIAPNSQVGRIFQAARRTQNIVKDVETQKNLIREMSRLYRDEAQKVKNSADQIRNYRQSLKDKLTSGEITFADYKARVISLDALATTYDTTANRLLQAADKFNDRRVIKMVGSAMLGQLVDKVKSALIMDTTKELNSLIDPNIIKTLVATNNRDFDTLLDMLISGDLSRVISDPQNKDLDLNQLKNNIRGDIKQILKENNGKFGQKFKDQLAQIITRRVKELKDALNALPPVPAEATQSGTPTTTPQPQPTSPPAASDSRCPSGYRWDRMSGVGCVQINCTGDHVSFAHWGYTGDCVCGSAGSISENKDDPNRRCTFPHSFSACPDCVFKCIKYTEECPQHPDIVP